MGSLEDRSSSQLSGKLAGGLRAPHDSEPLPYVSESCWGVAPVAAEPSTIFRTLLLCSSRQCSELGPSLQSSPTCPSSLLPPSFRTHPRIPATSSGFIQYTTERLFPINHPVEHPVHLLVTHLLFSMILSPGNVFKE